MKHSITVVLFIVQIKYIFFMFEIQTKCIFSLILILTLLCADGLVHSLHTQYHGLLHQQKLNQSSSIYFENQFSTINNQIDYVNRTLTLNNSEVYQPLIQVQIQIAKGVAALHEALLKYNLPISHTTRLCPKITQFNRTELRKFISYIQNKYWEGDQFLAKCSSCNFIQSDIQLSYNQTNNYITLVNETLDGKYCANEKQLYQRASGLVNLNNSYFKPNLQAGNWYYGSTTASDFKIYMFKRSASYNLTNCPLVTPFVNDKDQICFRCKQGALFNLGNQSCDSCGDFGGQQILNVSTAKCDFCLGNIRIVDNKATCQPCSSYEQIFNKTTNKCEKCLLDQIYIESNNSCLTIKCNASSPRLNPTIKQCQPCKSTQIIDPHNITQCIKTNYGGMCPPNTPYYNLTTHTCVPCQNGTTFNPNQKLCKTNVPLVTLRNNTNVGKHNQTQINTKQLNGNKNTTNVGSKNNTINKNGTASNFNGSIGSNGSKGSNGTQIPNITEVNKTNPKAQIPIKILCQDSTLYYNRLHKKCQACKSETQFNRTVGKCLPCTDRPYFNKTTKTCEKCQDGYIYEKDTKTCENIVICNYTQTFIRNTLSCIQTASLCQQNQTYYQQINKCIFISSFCTDDQLYSDKLNACISVSSTCKFDEIYDAAQIACIPEKNTCQQDQFYDYKLKICQKMVTCNRDEVFNRKSKICQKMNLFCKNNQYFNNNTLKCVRYQYITSPYQPNLIYQNSDFKYFIYAYNQQIQNNAQLTDCPAETPYYVQQTDSCISCSNPSMPYFNLDSQICFQCDVTSALIYNQFKHQCVILYNTQVRIPSTISRMNI